MGKQKRKGTSKIQPPFVTVCTPTFNRRPFIPWIIQCFKNQTYPRDRMEWVVVDDGTDKVRDLFEAAELGDCLKYVSCEEKMTLGKKRNTMHDHSKGDILVYMDDDDYYPPERVAHSVDMLTRHKTAMCAGSSELHVWFGHINRMVQFGPYGPNHATAGTFAFKRKLLETSRYEEGASLAEEKYFLKNYTVPFVQLEPKKTILVFSHSHNTFDKKTLLANMENNPFQKYADVEVESYVKDSGIRDFFTKQMEGLLDSYDPGKPAMKPDVMAQIEVMKEEREKRRAGGAGAGTAGAGNKPIGVKMQMNDGKVHDLTGNQVVAIIKQQAEEINRLKAENGRLTGLIAHDGRVTAE
jgi:glycosyltransferase involved in cell wall biosynthesis